MLELLLATGIAAGVTARPGVLAGHVVNENGAPVVSAMVRATLTKMAAGKPRFAESRTVDVDGNGQFVIADLTPGTYTVRGWPHDDCNATGGAEGYRPSERTGPIELRAGSEVRDVKIVLRKGRMFGVSGRVMTEARGERIPQRQLWLTPVDGEDASAHRAWIHEGTFRFTNVPPGSFFIQTNPNELTRDAATGRYRKLTLHARARVVVGEGDLAGVTVRLGPGGEMTGGFKMKSPRGEWQGAGLALEPLEGLGSWVCVRTEADGTFRASNIPRDRYRLHVTAPDGSYVTSIRDGGREIRGTLDLTAGGVARVEIFVSPHAGEICGQVRDAGASTAVALLRPGEAEPVLTGTSGDGSFRLRNIGPGNYRIVAVEDGGLIDGDDAETWRALEMKSAAVAVGEGARVRLALGAVRE